jgi:hypothetical protein
MPPEVALLESRALRASVSTRTEALDRVKVLALLPDGLHLTTRMVAAYFEVSENVLYSLIQRHREELEGNGLHVLKGQAAANFVTCNMKGMQVSGRGVTIYPRRAVLNIAMLLRDSSVAREVRSHLLDTEAAAVRHEPPAPTTAWGMPPGRRLGPGPHWDEYEYLRTHPDAPVPEQYGGPEHYSDPEQYSDPERYGGLEQPRWMNWVQSVDRRLDAHGRVIGAMSEQLHQVGDDVRELRKDIARLDHRRS